MLCRGGGAGCWGGYPSRICIWYKIHNPPYLKHQCSWQPNIGADPEGIFKGGIGNYQIRFYHLVAVMYLHFESWETQILLRLWRSRIRYVLDRLLCSIFFCVDNLKTWNFLKDVYSILLVHLKHVQQTFDVEIWIFFT